MCHRITCFLQTCYLASMITAHYVQAADFMNPLEMLMLHIARASCTATFIEFCLDAHSGVSAICSHCGAFILEPSRWSSVPTYVGGTISPNCFFSFRAFFKLFRHSGYSWKVFQKISRWFWFKLNIRYLWYCSIVSLKVTNQLSE